MSAEPDPRTLELYKIAVEMADRGSARRGTANAFFLSLQTAVISIATLVDTKLGDSNWPPYLALSLAGVAISASWWLQLRSYRELNAAKFAVINRIEKQFPVRIFTDEWESLTSGPPLPLRKRYAELGAVEMITPIVFAGLFVLLFLAKVAV
ncbi:hypothetical protein OG729_31440 [Streptomyces sp. NBC_00210]|uniref:RipA family octameric membrane protein n=1 Tax=unclassified Streptomyces TaxID=2593676 RepID=UPI00324FBC77